LVGDDKMEATVELYLVQHGEAKPEEQDPARPLTDRGREDAARVARAAARSGLRVTAIHHSGKLRARQTAEILAAELKPEKGVSQLDGLAPNDDPHLAERVALRQSAPVLLVGHLPHLSRLASLLLVGDPSREIIAFRMGGMVCLDRGDEGLWRLRWALVPELAAQSP
jgi:phosphohistidine phosphatase